MRLSKSTGWVILTATLLFGASIAGCGQDNDKTATSDAPPGVQPSGPPMTQEDYMNKARAQSNSSNNPYGKGS